MTTKMQAEEKAKMQAEEMSKAEAEETAKKEVDEKDNKQPEAMAKEQTAEKAKNQMQAEENLNTEKQAEEKAKKQAKVTDKKQAEEMAKKQAEERAKMKAAEKALDKDGENQSGSSIVAASSQVRVNSVLSESSVHVCVQVQLFSRNDSDLTWTVLFTLLVQSFLFEVHIAQAVSDSANLDREIEQLLLKFNLLPEEILPHFASMGVRNKTVWAIHVLIRPD